MPAGFSIVSLYFIRCCRAIARCRAFSFPALLLIGSKVVFFGLILGELGLVFYLSSRVMSMSSAAAKGTFLLFAALNGVTLASIFLVYTAGSIASTFMVSAATFGAMSAYGMATKRDLTGFGSFVVMGLFGVVIASVVNLFLKSEAVYWVTTYIGVLVFVGLSAYDTWKLKRMAETSGYGEALANLSILGALTLYLDFVNLFLMLLRLLGRRR
ncbi:MAG: Bax inhibitor-1/YccA family protein [Candidatus Deferrimicrobium sp.]